MIPGDSCNMMAVSTTDWYIAFSSAWLLMISRAACCRTAGSRDDAGGPQYRGEFHIFCFTQRDLSSSVMRNRSCRAVRSSGLTRMPLGRSKVKPSSHSNGIMVLPRW